VPTPLLLKHVSLFLLVLVPRVVIAVGGKLPAREVTHARRVAEARLVARRVVNVVKFAMEKAAVMSRSAVSLMVEVEVAAMSGTPSWTPVLMKAAVMSQRPILM